MIDNLAFGFPSRGREKKRNEIKTDLKFFILLFCFKTSIYFSFQKSNYVFLYEKSENCTTCLTKTVFNPIIFC